MFVSMKSVEQLIGDLLLRHNCVIVPSFGGFVAKPISAKIDFDKGTMLPPSKSLLFNKQLISNDGLLINQFSLENNITFDQAAAEVEVLVNNWKTALKQRKRIELDRIGILYFDEEQNVCFEQDRFFNLLLESFGLGQVHFLTEEDAPAFKPQIAPAIQREQNTEEKEIETPIIPISRPTKKVVAEAIKLVEVSQKVNGRKIRRYVAAACFLPFAFYSIWIPVKTDVLESGILSVKDFNPFHKTSPAKYRQTELTSLEININSTSSLSSEIEGLPDEVAVYSYKYDDDFFIPVEIGKSIETPNLTNVNKAVFTPDAMNYIVGCFGDKSNAENLVLKLQEEGLDARILDMNKGLHRVTAGSVISTESLQSIKSQIEGLGMAGWTLK